MKKVIALLVAAVAIFAFHSEACTSIIVAKGASADGSVMTTYNCDTWGTFHPLYHFKAAKHAKGEMRAVIDRDSRIYHGQIPEALETYNVVGNINEWQVCISETTFGGRPEMEDSTGILDYGSLMNIALQRSKTAREAIQVMTTLAETYGYNSEGESFSICDPNEAWIMEMVGCGAGSKTVAWVAIRIPDNAICAHANQSRISTFDQKDKKNVLYSKNVISYARKMGWFSGKDADFSFCNAYHPYDFGGLRFCEARVWSVFNRFGDGMDRYLDFAMGNTKAEPMPLWIIPNRKISVQDVEAALRDHYEGTPMAQDSANDPGQGIYESPYRPTPLRYEVEGKKYFNERPISTMQTAFTWIGQMRSWLPRQVGGVLWFGNDDGNMVAYVPNYCCNTDVAECFKEKGGVDATHFSYDNAYWVCNMVSNMVYPRYSLTFPALKAVRDSLDASYFTAQPTIEAKAQALCKTNPSEAVGYLTKYSKEKGAQMLDRWKQLAAYIIVKYNDNVSMDEKDGQFLKRKGGFKAKVSKPGYSPKVAKQIADQTGTHYEMPAQ